MKSGTAMRMTPIRILDTMFQSARTTGVTASSEAEAPTAARRRRHRTIPATRTQVPEPPRTRLAAAKTGPTLESS